MGGNGPSSLSSPIPSNVLFAVSVSDSSSTSMFSAFPPVDSVVAIDPSGAGMVSMTLEFDGEIDGRAVALAFNAVADSPLANRPPLADAGPNQTVDSSTCEAHVTLDASASSDPDNNIMNFRWYNGSSLMGTGQVLNATFAKTEDHDLTLMVVDKYGSVSRDNVSVRVNLPSACH